MKKLFILRHAEAPGSYDLSDKERPLSERGIKQAKSVATHIKNVDHVLCSSALRTKMTFQAMEQSGLQVGKVDYLDTIYNAPAGDLLHEIQKAESESLLVIAHNPGIHALAATLSGKGEQIKLEQLNLAYHPATLTILECPIDNWSEIQPQQNKLIDLVIPD